MAIQFREGTLNFPPTQTGVFFPGPVHSAQAARPLSWPSTGLGARKGKQLRSLPENLCANKARRLLRSHDRLLSCRYARSQ